MNKGNNSSKITISLKREEREALATEAEAEGVKVPTLCASVLRKHLKHGRRAKPKSDESDKN